MDRPGRLLAGNAVFYAPTRAQHTQRPLIRAIYPRVSSAKQEDGYSLDSPQAALAVELTVYCGGR